MARRLGDVACFIAVCGTRKYGPFPTRAAAENWMSAFIDSTGESNVLYEWHVEPVLAPGTAVGLADVDAQAGA